MIRRYDPSYVYEITAQCIKCPAEWKLSEPRPVDLWWQLYQKKWECLPDLESDAGHIKAKCGTCVAKEIKIQKEARKAMMAEIARLKAINQTPSPVLEYKTCEN